MITYKIATLDDLKDDMLQDYLRYTYTTKIYIVKHQELQLRDIDFTDQWDTQRLTEIAQELRQTIQNHGKVILAYDKDRVIGFTNIEHTLYFDTYINMPYIHVSKEYRGQHIGQELFHRICQQAKQLGGTKLYISAHPSIETIHFYQNMGCTLTKQIIPEFLEKEPYDIQLEKVL